MSRRCKLLTLTKVSVVTCAAPLLQINKTFAARCNRGQICAKVTSGQERMMPYRAAVARQGRGDQSDLQLS